MDKNRLAPYGCGACSMTFTHAHLLKKHLSIHAKEKFKCKFCSIELPSKQYLMLHELSHSTEHTLNLQCDICGRKFKDVSKLNKHEKIHSQQETFTCDICKKTFYNKTTLVIHRRIHKTHGSYQCNLCTKSFRNNENLRNHKKKCHKSKFTCEYCGKLFQSQKKYQDHRKSHAGSKIYKCDKCGKVEKSLTAITRHKRSHHGSEKYKCTDCGETFDYYVSFQIHQYKHVDRDVVCDICGAVFHKLSQMILHKTYAHNAQVKSNSSHNAQVKSNSSHNVQVKGDSTKNVQVKGDSTKTLQIKCDKCPRTFSSRENLKSHEMIHRKLKLKPHLDSDNIQSENVKNTQEVTNLDFINTSEKGDNHDQFSCRFCKAMFNTQEELEYHERIHSIQKPYGCNYCNQSYKLSSELRKHLQTHVEVNPYRCPYCTSRFNQNTKLLSHIETMHPGTDLKQFDITSEEDDNDEDISSVMSSSESGSDIDSEETEIYMFEEDENKTGKVNKHGTDDIKHQAYENIPFRNVDNKNNSVDILEPRGSSQTFDSKTCQDEANHASTDILEHERLSETFVNKMPQDGTYYNETDASESIKEDTTRQSVKRLPIEDTTHQTLKRLPIEDTTHQTLKRRPIEDTTHQSVKRLPIEDTTRQSVKRRPIEDTTRQSVKRRPIEDTTHQSVKRRPIEDTTHQSVKRRPIEDTTHQSVKRRPIAFLFFGHLEGLQEKSPKKLTKEKQVPIDKNISASQFSFEIWDTGACKDKYQPLAKISEKTHATMVTKNQHNLQRVEKGHVKMSKTNRDLIKGTMLDLPKLSNYGGMENLMSWPSPQQIQLLENFDSTFDTDVSEENQVSDCEPKSRQKLLKGPNNVLDLDPKMNVSGPNKVIEKELKSKSSLVSGQKHVSNAEARTKPKLLSIPNNVLRDFAFQSQLKSKSLNGPKYFGRHFHPILNDFTNSESQNVNPNQQTFELDKTSDLTENDWIKVSKNQDVNPAQRVNDKKYLKSVSRGKHSTPLHNTDSDFENRSSKVLKSDNSWIKERGQWDSSDSEITFKKKKTKRKGKFVKAEKNVSFFVANRLPGYYSSLEECSSGESGDDNYTTVDDCDTSDVDTARSSIDSPFHNSTRVNDCDTSDVDTERNSIDSPFHNSTRVNDCDTSDVDTVRNSIDSPFHNSTRVDDCDTSDVDTARESIDSPVPNDTTMSSFESSFNNDTSMSCIESPPNKDTTKNSFESSSCMDTTKSSFESSPYNDTSMSCIESSPNKDTMKSSFESSSCMDTTKNSFESSPYNDTSMSCIESSPNKDTMKSSFESSSCMDTTKTSFESSPYNDTSMSCIESPPNKDTTMSSFEDSPFNDTTTDNLMTENCRYTSEISSVSNSPDSDVHSTGYDSSIEANSPNNDDQSTGYDSSIEANRPNNDDQSTGYDSSIEESSMTDDCASVYSLQSDVPIKKHTNKCLLKKHLWLKRNFKYKRDEFGMKNYVSYVLHKKTYPDRQTLRDRIEKKYGKNKFMTEDKIADIREMVKKKHLKRNIYPSDASTVACEKKHPRLDTAKRNTYPSDASTVACEIKLCRLDTAKLKDIYASDASTVADKRKHSNNGKLGKMYTSDATTIDDEVQFPKHAEFKSRRGYQSDAMTVDSDIKFSWHNTDNPDNVDCQYPSDASTVECEIKLSQRNASNITLPSKNDRVKMSSQKHEISNKAFKPVKNVRIGNKSGLISPIHTTQYATVAKVSLCKQYNTLSSPRYKTRYALRQLSKSAADKQSDNTKGQNDNEELNMKQKKNSRDQIENDRQEIKINKKIGSPFSKNLKSRKGQKEGKKIDRKSCEKGDTKRMKRGGKKKSKPFVCEDSRNITTDAGKNEKHGQQGVKDKQLHESSNGQHIEATHGQLCEMKPTNVHELKTEKTKTITINKGRKNRSKTVVMSIHEKKTIFEMVDCTEGGTDGTSQPSLNIDRDINDTSKQSLNIGRNIGDTSQPSLNIERDIGDTSKQSLNIERNIDDTSKQSLNIGRDISGTSKPSLNIERNIGEASKPSLNINKNEYPESCHQKKEMYENFNEEQDSNSEIQFPGRKGYVRKCKVKVQNIGNLIEKDNNDSNVKDEIRTHDKKRSEGLCKGRTMAKVPVNGCSLKIDDTTKTAFIGKKKNNAALSTKNLNINLVDISNNSRNAVQDNTKWNKNCKRGNKNMNGKAECIEEENKRTKTKRAKEQKINQDEVGFSDKTRVEDNLYCSSEEDSNVIEDVDLDTFINYDSCEDSFGINVCHQELGLCDVSTNSNFIIDDEKQT